MPVRILQIMGGMHRGGVETCLMHFLRKIDRKRFQIQILVHEPQKCEYDDEIYSLGIPIIPCPSYKNPFLYARNFISILVKYGPYDIIHSHVHFYSGFIFLLARMAGVKNLIVHSHNDTRILDFQAKGLRKLYLKSSRKLLEKFATVGLACSKPAAKALYGEDWEKDPRWRLLYCTIDLNPFEKFVKNPSRRTLLNIPSDAFVVGHVGRFTKLKNHRFMLQIFAEIVKKQPSAVLLLVGGGSLMSETRQRVKEMRLQEKVIFAGSRNDVPDILLNCIDVFLFPSLNYEGLPLALLEVQAAGLPCVISDGITEELDIVKPLIQRLPLEASVSTWAEAVLKNYKEPRSITQEEALALIKNSYFNIDNNILNLESLYEELLKNGPDYCLSSKK
jgi:glycosyltransferase involved in cell wall biosynthesis